MRDGIVSSTTVMTPCPWAPHALRLLAENPDLPSGVHLTLIAEHADYRWGPRAPRGLVPSLVDASGFFYRNDQRDALLAQAALDEVEIEFRAQIAAVLAAGLTPTHLDWHCLDAGGRPDIFGLTLELAQEFGLALRVDAPFSAERAQQAGFRTSNHGVLDSFNLATEDKSARYVALLRDLPAGLSEWAVHPSLGDAEAQAMEPIGWRVRKADFDFLISAQARRTIAEEASCSWIFGSCSQPDQPRLGAHDVATDMGLAAGCARDRTCCSCHTPRARTAQKGPSWPCPPGWDGREIARPSARRVLAIRPGAGAKPAARG
jgi:predicted glycoside hydrolase/deacetylase ChbG (UPF0249 family)